MTSILRVTNWNSGAAILALALLPAIAFATDNSQHYLLESTVNSGYSQLGVPSVNGLGDVTFRAVMNDNSRRVMADIWTPYTNGVPGSYSSLFVQGGSGTAAIVSPFPDINDARTIAFSRTETPGDVGGVRRRIYDLATKTYAAASDPVGQWDFSSPYSYPFRNSAVIVSVANNGQVAFPSTAPNIFGVNYDAIFSSDSLITSPASAIAIEEEVLGIDSLDAYVDASNAGWVVRGSNALGQLGIYRVTTRGSSDRVTPVGAFVDLGSRPSINDSGTIAFAATAPGGKQGVYLSYIGDATPRYGTVQGIQAPSISNLTDKIAINKFNQVAFLGDNGAGQTALYSTNLGATRKIIAVGEQLAGSKVTALRLQDGIASNGSLVYLATTEAAQCIVRTNRAYTQGALRNTPSESPWSSTPYLLRSKPESNLPTSSTIGSDGCNLTTTANVLSFFGVDATPGELQNWLLSKHFESKGSYLPGSDYISERNDFLENIVLEYSRDRGSAVLVKWKGPHLDEATNRATLISELKNGHPVKIHVPNKSKQAGHYILAYGLKDPLAAQIEDSDILIHDPGNPSRKVVSVNDPAEINTLADYSQHLSAVQSVAAGTDWLNNRQRLTLYDSTTNPNASQAVISIFSPVQVVLTSPSGHKVGIDPATGVFDQIGDARYFEQTGYDSIDDETSVWLSDGPIKNLLLNDPEPGDYQLEVIGVGQGAYNIVFSGGAKLGFSTEVISGVTTVGKREHFSFSLTRQFTLSPPGDFNGDNTVDGADLEKWKADFGSGAGSDADDDGDTDGVDFLIWQRAVGASSASASVPEPATTILALNVSIVIAGTFRRSMADWRPI